MPLSKDTEGGGTEADGTRSAIYCSKCYRGGTFISPDMTAAEMQDLVKGKLKEMRFPGFLAWFFVKDIPRLKRWSGQP